MKQITIDCTAVHNPAELHSLLKGALAFPDWYGNNLDALHDCLTGLREETHITFLHFSALPFPSMGLVRVLQDSENENPNLEVSLVTN